MRRSVKIHAIIALILYPIFAALILGIILWELLKDGVINNSFLYDFLSKINQFWDPVLWPTWFGILMIIIAITIVSAELRLHIGLLKSVKESADSQLEENLRNTTTSYSPATITFDSTGTGHVSGGYSQSRPILNLFRILQVLLYILLVVLTPVIFPFDAIIHLIIYKGTDDDEDI